MPEIGKFLIAVGLILLIAGLILYFAGSRFEWLGNLPGDFRWESGSTRFYFPLATMIIVSIVLTVVINLIRRIF